MGQRSIDGNCNCASAPGRCTLLRRLSRSAFPLHFAVEVDNWEATLAHLDALGVAYSRAGGGRIGTTIGGENVRYGQREDSSEYYTYIHDPDGNMIELVCHPLGRQDAEGNQVEVAHDAPGLRWRQLPGFVQQAVVEG